MAYRIRYGKKAAQEPCGKLRKLLADGGFAALLVAIAVLIRLMIPESGVIFRKLLIPGMPDAAVESFSEMMLNIREGMGISQAAEVFCYEIFDDEGS